MGSEVETLKAIQGWFGENTTSFQNAVDTFRESTNKLVTALGMQAENDKRKSLGLSMAYDEAAFEKL